MSQRVISSAKFATGRTVIEIRMDGEQVGVGSHAIQNNGTGMPVPSLRQIAPTCLPFYQMSLEVLLTHSVERA